MAEWIYFLHAPRENFAATMTAEEQAVWAVHFDRLRRLMDEGIMIAVGPTLGPTLEATADLDATVAADRSSAEQPAGLERVAVVCVPDDLRVGELVQAQHCAEPIGRAAREAPATSRTEAETASAASARTWREGSPRAASR